MQMFSRCYEKRGRWRKQDGGWGGNRDEMREGGRERALVIGKDEAGKRDTRRTKDCFATWPDPALIQCVSFSAAQETASTRPRLHRPAGRRREARQPMDMQQHRVQISRNGCAVSEWVSNSRCGEGGDKISLKRFPNNECSLPLQYAHANTRRPSSDVASPLTQLGAVKSENLNPAR